MNDRTSSRPGVPRSRALVPKSGRHLPRPVALSETRRAARSVYQSDHPGIRHANRLKWLISTCLAAAVGVFAIGFVLFGSMDGERRGDGVIETVRQTFEASLKPVSLRVASLTGTSGGKTDRLSFSMMGLTSKHIIHDSVQQKKGEKTYIAIQPYARVVARLSSIPPDESLDIPPLNPLTLYAPATKAGDPQSAGEENITVKVLDLVADILPAEDGATLTDGEVAVLVAATAEEFEIADKAAAVGELAEEPSAPAVPEEAVAEVAEPIPPNTAVIEKNVVESDNSPKFEGQEVRVVGVSQGDTLTGLLKKNGVEAWLARTILEAARTVVEGDQLLAGQELRLTMVPSPVQPDLMEPAMVSLFNEGHGHMLTVARNEAGEYMASETPIATSLLDVMRASEQQQRATLYTGLYAAALSQGLPATMITSLLKTFAYDTDFKRRVGPGDGFEAFYEIEGDDAAGPEGTPGQLLFMALTVGGETRKFYHFRTPDGDVDYYDLQGNNAKKFLLRKPIRGDGRFTSGFGVRVHPLLKIRKMHTGVDWSTPTGTPILAAGNGVIEEFGRKGGNGNYIRVRHANGYQTAYSHLSRFQAGLGVGSKVTQGQVIGYVGSTGLSSGPHLHFEVLINNTFVNPLTIHVPRERQLTGKLLADFQKERTRIDELMARAPVTSVVAQAGRNEG